MQEHIIIKGAREHNLKDVSLTLPRNKMIVFTGLSGSGKSSLAFDTIFAEGQRRYVESLSAYARQFLGQMQKPDVDDIQGLSPAISIDQKAHSANPRSTVATITEIYDYLRVLYARVGKPHCPNCETPIRKMTAEEMVDFILEEAAAAYKEPLVEDAFGKKRREYGDTLILAPAVRGRKGEYHQMLYDWYNAGFSQARVNGNVRSLRTRLVLDGNMKHVIELVVDTYAPTYVKKRWQGISYAPRRSGGVCTRSRVWFSRRVVRKRSRAYALQPIFVRDVRIFFSRNRATTFFIQQSLRCVRSLPWSWCEDALV